MWDWQSSKRVGHVSPARTSGKTVAVQIRHRSRSPDSNYHSERHTSRLRSESLDIDEPTESTPSVAAAGRPGRSTSNTDVAARRTEGSRLQNEEGTQRAFPTNAIVTVTFKS